jgi:hypothetical protein
MEKMNFDFINLVKIAKDYLININKLFRDSSTTYVFSKRYYFRGGLDNKLQPFSAWFKKDIQEWISGWANVKEDTGELFSAKITIYYYWGSDLKTVLHVTDNYQYFTNNILSSEGRIAKWKHFIMYTSIQNRFIPMNMIHSIEVDLEWHNYVKSLSNIAKFISQGDPKENIEKIIDEHPDSNNPEK